MHEQQNSTDITLWQELFSEFDLEMHSPNGKDGLVLAAFKFFESANSVVINADRP